MRIEPAKPKKSRWWLILVILGAGCLLFLAFVAGIFALVFGMMKSSGAYLDALAMARADSRVVASLGTPIEEGWFVTGNVNVSNNGGDANLSIPLSGPKGGGQLAVVARKSGAVWSFQRLVLYPERGGSIDLLAPEPLPLESP